MKPKQVEVYLPRDEMLFSWDPENMDKYWSQCRQYDRHPLERLERTQAPSLSSDNFS